MHLRPEASEFPKTSSLLLTKPIGAQARLWEPVQLSSATVRTSPGMSRNRALSSDGGTTRNSWRTLRLVKQALIALTPPQIRSLSAFRIRVQRISQTRGLVLGHVQSGKTTNFLTVAAKACGSPIQRRHRLGGHSQFAPEADSQERAEQASCTIRALVAWYSNRGVQIRRQLAYKPLGRPRQASPAGGQKASLSWKRLADWLYDSDDVQRRKLKILVIDDEADQAGLDVSEGPERAGIHEQLMRILELEPENLEEGEREFRCAYLAYTATPYANVLTSQAENGLYPEGLYDPLEKPDRYVGSDELFGENQVGSPVRIIQGDQPHEGLREAVCWFVLATAARAALEGSVEKIPLVNDDSRCVSHC